MCAFKSLSRDHKDKELDEEIDDVQVKRNSSLDILIVVEFLDQLVRVVDDVSAEHD